MYTACAHTLTAMPTDKARYLMGVGTPRDILSCIGFGVDQFDCVMPSRDGRHGKVETSDGRLNIKNKRFFDDDRPLDSDCDCSCCRQFSRSYIRHLFSAKEILAGTLMTIHNLHFYLRMSAEARAAILEDRYGTWSRQQIERQQSGRWRADGA
jgi:queuine tRNA-ribosyltransferase